MHLHGATITRTREKPRPIQFNMRCAVCLITTKDKASKRSPIVQFVTTPVCHCPVKDYRLAVENLCL